MANLRRLHAVGSKVFFEDPEFVASDKSLFTVRAAWEAAGAGGRPGCACGRLVGVRAPAAPLPAITPGRVLLSPPALVLAA